MVQQSPDLQVGTGFQKIQFRKETSMERLTRKVCGGWDDALRAKREVGWESRKVKGEREDICTDCQFEGKGYGRDKA